MMIKVLNGILVKIKEEKYEYSCFVELVVFIVKECVIMY